MDLWIRSQDKHLLAKYNMLAVAQVTPKTQAQVMAFVSDDLGYQKLGAYKTKERALEVLDEIQTLLLGDVLLLKNFNVNSEDLSEIGNQLKTKVLGMVDVNNKDADIKFIPRDCIVYEMPKE